MSTDCRSVNQIRVTNARELAQLRGSKYVQSNVKETFGQAAMDLKNGLRVLYTGTPCQIEGLKSYLRNEDKNLICMDFICHGVPSEKAWKSYVQLQEEKHHSRAKQFYFRNKTTGWKDFSCLMYFENGQTYTKPFEDDLWGAAFVRNADLRRCCYDCAFKKVRRVSDITVADAWGIENGKPELFDDMGCSLIYVHSENGRRLISDIRSKLKLIEYTQKEAMAEYGRLTYNSEKHPTRDLFYQHIDDLPFDRLVRTYAKPSAKKRIVYVLRRLGLLGFVKKIMKR